MTLDLDPAPLATAAGARRGPLGLVLVSAILSAALASGGTAAILLATAPTATPATRAPSQAAGTGTLTSLGIGDAIAAVAAAAEPSVVTIAPVAGVGPAGASGGGSGTVVSADGLILTTTIVAPADTVYTVTLADQRETTARVAATDPAHGLVLLDAAATGLTPARLNAADGLRVGQLVLALGSPLGEFTNTVTQGIVSGLNRSIDLRDPSTGGRVTLDGLIQTDAAINAGSSGGPLLDISGAVVGVIATPAGDGQGIGFAIPVAAARDLVASAATP